MFFMNSCRKMNNLAKFAILTSFFLSVLFFLGPNANATDEISYFDNTTRISVGYRVCTDHGSSYVCDSRVTRNSISPAVYDSNTGVAQYTITPSYTTCDNNPDYDCRLVVDTISFEIRNNSSYPTSYNFINGKVWTVHDLFFGKYPTLSGNNIWANKYNVTSSFDLAIWKSSSLSYVCGDSTPDECLFGYWQDKTVYDDVNTYSGFDFSASKNLFSSTYYEAAFRSYAYNKSSGHLDMTSQSQYNIIFDLPRTAPIVFYAQFWGSDTIYQVNDNGEGVEVTDIQREIDNINSNMDQAQDSMDNIDLGFTVPNIFTPFLNLFNNETNNCVLITNLATWIHSSETQICSPWSTDIRATVTPVVSFVIILLVFMFVIRWLNHNDLHEES